MKRELKNNFGALEIIMRKSIGKKRTLEATVENTCELRWTKNA